jgi:hypothetical protein
MLAVEDSVVAAERSIPADSLAMPAYPQPKSGALVGQSAGPYDLDASWPGSAGICADPSLLEVLAARSGDGAILLLELPAATERVTEYPIVRSDGGLPDAPAAQIGVQLLGGAAVAFEGYAGSVELSRLGDRVSGRFAVTLQEVTTGRAVKYAGVFERLRVDSLPADRCHLSVPSSAPAPNPNPPPRPR